MHQGTRGLVAQESAPLAARVSTAGILLDRGWGRASQPHAGEDGISCELGTDVDPFMLHLFAALAEKERRLIRQRTKEALREAKGEGRQAR